MSKSGRPPLTRGNGGGFRNRKPQRVAMASEERIFARGVSFSLRLNVPSFFCFFFFFGGGGGGGFSLLMSKKTSFFVVVSVGLGGSLFGALVLVFAFVGRALF